MNTYAWILASNSPRRRELLTLFGHAFSVQPADVDESQLPEEDPGVYVSRLAHTKACTVAARQEQPGLVLAADTTVADGDTILGKPQDAEEACSMLRQLRGRSHQVYTAVAMALPGCETIALELCQSQVPMRAYSDAELEAYVSSGDPLDKAGAYAIQHAGFHPVEHFSGCFASVMGLPLCHVARSLPSLNVLVEVDIARACQAYLGYSCSIARDVQNGKNVG
ncbi:MAG: septum formation protein Maf [Chloroflexi bacterium HGW-Chloroflexi-10]|nr:MAG: septum formation protein Maf [Chloroflexi bacterium HGW-Chloroflexi-10]